MKLQKHNRGRYSCLQQLQAATCLAEKPLMILVLQVKSPQYKAAVGASNVSHQHNILVTLHVSVLSKAGDSQNKLYGDCPAVRLATSSTEALTASPQAPGPDSRDA